MKRLRLATRASALAMAQSGNVAALLETLHPGLEVELIPLKSEGDRLGETPLALAGGRGLFTRVLEEALLHGKADAAVHSLKDLPTQPSERLALAAIGAREDWRDAWVSPAHASPWDLPPGATIGTGSPRRRAQIAQRRPDLHFEELRGNIDTRLRKLADGEVDGAVLAVAGLRRMGIADRVTRVFEEDEMLPAAGQGFIGVQTLAGGDAHRICRAFNDPVAESEALCERAFLAAMQAGCLAPVGVLARRALGRMVLDVFVGLDPKAPLRLRAEDDAHKGEVLARALAEKALAAGPRP